MDLAANALVTDLYQLNMMQAYLDRGETGTAVFELFVRKLPERRAFLIAAGLAQVVDFLERMRFSPADLAWLKDSGRFRANLIDYAERFRFAGDVDAMPEGTALFVDEPVLRVAAPLPQAQFVETRVMNFVHFQSMITAKAARVVLAAQGKPVIDFGLRRAHGAEAGVMAARASYIAGFVGTATVEAEKDFGIATFGTMAHSYVQAHDDEADAFERFARARPDNLTLLIDTYDTEAAAHKVVTLARKLAPDGIRIGAVRIDSGDLVELSRRVRAIFDDGGLADIGILASGGLDEDRIAAIRAAGAPIDGFGVGTSVTTSSDAPSLDIAYKLVEYAGRPRRKQSPGKETWPGRKQVWRRTGADGRMCGDTLGLEHESRDGAPLLVPAMRDGRRVGPAEPLADIRARAANELARLPAALRRLDGTAPYPVTPSEALRDLARDLDEDVGRR